MAPASNPGEGPQEARALLLPAGLGTLYQDQISLRLQSGDLLIKVTPLDEGIIRLTAPDTYERLRGLVGIYGGRAAGTNSGSPSSLFLVSLFSYKPDVIYEPEDLLLVNRGLRLRPKGIAPITPSWGTQRLGQQETRMAIYAFEGEIEWEAELVAEYQQLRNELWRDQVLPLVQAERAKVRARGGGAGSPWSRSVSRP
ncbi:MAG: hypothetical protein MUO50_17410 [Longimicrobiales bacterium]|nr:hypothetical protein [Longimicrobiales bacterium]